MNGWTVLRYILLNATGLSVMFVLCDRKYSLRRSLRFLSVGFVAITAANILLQDLIGPELWGRVFPLTTNLTGFILLLFLSRNRGFPLLFSLLTAIQFGGIIAMPGFVLVFVGGGAVWMDILIRLVLTVPLIFWLYRFFRPAYLSAMPLLGKGGWGLLCLMPLSFYIIFYLLLMNGEANRTPLHILVVVLTLIIMISAYWLIFFLFRKYSLEASLKTDRDILRTQVQALNRQMDTIHRTEKQIRVYRHDMRHYMENIAALLRNGDVDAALRAIGQYDDQFKDTRTHYCRNTTLNAILASYLQQAEEEGVNVSFKGDLPEELPCDALGLATVFANAIENARHAMRKLPEDAEKRLEIICINGPQLVIEIANSYDGQAEFDENQYPIAHADGHGLGTKSIVTFIEENGGLLDYKADELFRLRMLLNKA